MLYFFKYVVTVKNTGFCNFSFSFIKYCFLELRIYSLLWDKLKLWITCNFWNLLQFINNFDTFSVKLGLLFIFEFPSHNPPDFTEQLLAYIYGVFNVVKKVLIVGVWFKLYFHSLLLINEGILSRVIPSFWSQVLWFFVIMIFREEPVIHIFILPFHIWHIFMSLI